MTRTWLRVASVILCLYACSQPNNYQPKTLSTEAFSMYLDGGTVYTAGVRNPDGKIFACYWQGTSEQDLPAPDGLPQANSIYVSGGVVYTAGWYTNGVSGTQDIACYWVGASKQDLPVPTGSTSSAAGSIYVSGGIVYVAGSYKDSTGKAIACYWAGTTEHDLPGGAGTTASGARSIYVSGSTVYVAGNYNNGLDRGCYWTSDGTTIAEQDLPNGQQATSIYVSGSTIYTSGVSNSWKPCYWAGTTEHDLPGGVAPYVLGTNSISVSGSIVYVGGYYYNGSHNVACYWTDNGTTANEQDLPNGNGGTDAYCYSICVSGGTIYTAGMYETSTRWVACYWVGTTLTDLN